MTEKNIERLQYLTLALTIIGQIVIGTNYMCGQSVWLVSNLIMCYRNFKLERSNADKVKDWAMTAITFGLMVVYYITH